MKRFAIFTMACIVILTAWNIAHARPDVNERLKNGAIIKNITIPANENWAYVNVEAIIDAPIGSVWAKLKDIPRWPKWLPMSEEADFLSREAAEKITPEMAGDKEQIISLGENFPASRDENAQSGHWQRMAYEYYNLPWPIKNEWVVRDYTYDESETLCRASWRRVDSNDAREDGHWELKPWGENGEKTDLRYYYRVKPKEGFPHPIFKAAVSLTVSSMIKAIRRETHRQGISKN